MATFTRTNAWNNGGTFANPVLLWYAKGVAVMQSRQLSDPSSWWFFAAIHGHMIGERNTFPDWTTLPNPPRVPVAPPPSQSDKDLYWDQCQHQTWYFAPWHRGYLMALEQQVRAAVVSLGGPSNWALPYWNYFGLNQSHMPPAFAQQNLDDGSPNPLFVKARFGPTSTGNVFIPMPPVDQECMKNDLFTGDDTATPFPGFGGPETDPLFSHLGNPNSGNLENNPHNMVHGAVGGRSPQGQRGLMSNPITAGLDPIFYLHHANIDRMWAAWNITNSRKNPTDQAWRQGPPSKGERKFAMPLPGGQSWIYTPDEMSDLQQLDYTYDDLQAPKPPPAPLMDRLMRLGVAEDVAASAAEEVAPMITGKRIELLGASPTGVRLKRQGARTTVILDSKVRSKVSASLLDAAEMKNPDRVFLELENVRGQGDGEMLSVYVNLPPEDNPADHPELLAGSAGLFGVSKASEPDSQHGGQGMNFVMDITKIIDDLHLRNALDTDSLDVSIVPYQPLDEGTGLTVGRVNVYRKGD